MAAAVNVHLPGGAINAQAFVHIDANEALVTNTPFARWEPVTAPAGAASRVGLPLFKMIRIFIAPCSVSPLAPNQTAARNASIWRIRFTAAMWSRVLTELKSSGYAAAPIATLRASDQSLLELTPATPGNLLIVAADWDMAEAFTLPGGGGAAAARRALLMPLSFLNLVNAVMLQKAGPASLARLADLAGYLGACSTQASRYDPVGIPQASSLALSAACGPDTLAEGVRAQRVARTLDKIRLPYTLRSPSLDEGDLSLELDDGITYHSSLSSSRNVLEQRVMYLAPRCVLGERPPAKAHACTICPSHLLSRLRLFASLPPYSHLTSIMLSLSFLAGISVPRDAPPATVFDPQSLA